MEHFIGEMAALAAAAGFSITSVCYTFAGRKINSVTSIAMSLPIAWLMVMVIHRLTLGEFFPTSATPERWLALGASGILAFAVASYFMLNAFQRIGPRLTLLIMVFAPVLGAVLAWLFLGQTLPPNAILGISVVIGALIWVFTERGKTKTERIEPDMRRGLIDACVATLTQSAAFVFASQGVSGGFPPFSATLIRLTVGMVAMWAVIAWQGKIRPTATIFNHNPRLFLQLAGAALSGPVISGSLVLLSFQFISVGVATTLSQTTAIVLIPVGYFVFKERITLRAVIGTLATIVGIAILFIA